MQSRGSRRLTEGAVARGFCPKELFCDAVRDFEVSFLFLNQMAVYKSSTFPSAPDVKYRGYSFQAKPP
jgi:hypothetical protein